MLRYTPRQVFAFLALAHRRRRRELRESLYVAALGAQGGREAIEGQMSQWES